MKTFVWPVSPERPDPVFGEGLRVPDGALVVPRLPEEGESWDSDLGEYVLDPAIAADQTTPVGHRERAHIVKALEASIILSGHPLTHGMLADEAKGLKMDVTVLAQEVHDKEAAFRTLEVERRQKKVQPLKRRKK